MTTYFFDIETFASDLNDVQDYKGDYKPNPPKERIVCISVLDLQNSKVQSFYGLEEEKILKQFWDCLKPGDLLIGFNSDSYDLPIIKVRTFANNVTLNYSLSEIQFLDIRKLFYGNNFLRGTLGDFVRLCGISVKTQNGSLMRGCILKEDWDSVVSHCEEDVYLTKEVYKRFDGCNLK